MLISIQLEREQHKPSVPLFLDCWASWRSGARARADLERDAVLREVRALLQRLQVREDPVHDRVDQALVAGDDALLELDVEPCGLGARDTLRLEAAMHLYGQDMTASTNPFETGLGWLVHLEMPQDFIGRQALEQVAAEGASQRLVGLKLQGRAIARHDYPVLHNGEKVGVVTSGSWSPTLEEAIALALVPKELAKVGSELGVEIRGQVQPATVVKRPFYRRG